MNANNLMALLERTRARARMGVSLNQSPVLPIASSYLSQYNLETIHMFLVAFASHSEDDNTAWINARGLMAMADFVINQHPDFKDLSESQKTALYYGSLKALWSATADNPVFTQDRITRSRQALISKLKRTKPTQAIVKLARKRWLEIWSTGSNTAIHIAICHWFPIQLSSGIPAAVRAEIQQSCTGHNEVFRNFTDEERMQIVIPVANEELQSMWAGLTEPEFLSFFTITAH